MKQPPSLKTIHIFAIAAGVLLTGIFFWSALNASAFNGPSAGPPTGSGAISTDASNNVYIGGNLNVTGTITGSGLGGSTISAGNVSAGAFGSNTGGGIYSFPAQVGIGTTDPYSMVEIVPPSPDNGLFIHDITVNTSTDEGGTVGGNPSLFTIDASDTTTYWQMAIESPGIGQIGIEQSSIPENTLNFANFDSTGSDFEGANLLLGYGGVAFCNQDCVIGGGDDKVFGAWTPDGSDTMSLGIVDPDAVVNDTSTDNEPIMTLNDSDNVGIGITTPSNRLAVEGSWGGSVTSYWYQSQLVALDSADPTKGLFIGYDDYNDAGAIQAGDVGNAYKNLLLEPNGGNVGIGTTTAASPLTVVGNIYATGNITCGGTCGGGGSSQWTTTSTGIFYSGGDVGIGTSNLSGYGWSGSDPIVAGASGGGVALSYDASDNQGYIESVSPGAAWRKLVIQSYGVGFWNNSGGSISAETMTLTNAGDLGIGTTSPTIPLTVVGSSSASAYCINGANCITAWPSGSSGANPSGLIGLSAVNGSASTFMRSDAAPTIDQTAAWSFSGLGNTTSTANISAASMNVTGGAQTVSTIIAPTLIGKCASTTVTISGATSSTGAVFVSPLTYPGNGYTWQGYVSAVNTVVVEECAATTTTGSAVKFNAIYIH